MNTLPFVEQTTLRIWLSTTKNSTRSAQAFSQSQTVAGYRPSQVSANLFRAVAIASNAGGTRPGASDAQMAHTRGRTFGQTVLIASRQADGTVADGLSRSSMLRFLSSVHTWNQNFALSPP